MRPIGASNTFFYYTQSGTGAIFDLRFRLDFHDPVQLPALTEAVQEALKLFPEFAVRPVIHDQQLYYEENDAPAPVLAEERIVRFGTEDTNGYLFSLQLCGERSVLTSWYHGMADAIGIFTIMRTFLYFYARKIGMDMPAEPGTAEALGIRLGPEDIPDLNRQDVWDPYRAYGDASAVPPWSYENPGAFSIPEPVYPGDENRFRVFDIELPVHSFLAKTKEYGVSFVPLLSAIVSGAVGSLWDIGEKPVTAMLPVNLRKPFGTKTVVNMSDGVMLPSDAGLLAATVDERARGLKDLMRKQMTEENYRRMMAQKAAAVDSFNSKGDLFATAFASTRLAPPGSKRPLTYALSYPGQVDFPKPYDGLVDYIHHTSLVRAFGLIVLAWQDRLQVQIMQRFDSSRAAEAICGAFRDQGLDAVLNDRGTMQGNMMILQELKQV